LQEAFRRLLRHFSAAEFIPFDGDQVSIRLPYMRVDTYIDTFVVLSLTVVASYMLRRVFASNERGVTG
jgi:hypothetical protein